MKKLNITKEAFEKSRYFTKKYGKLEYVSESGKMFKTNKGKVLMFKESIKDIAPGIQDWGSTIYVEPLEVEMSWDDVYYIVKKDCRQYPLLEEELGLEPYEEPSDEQIREWIETNPKSFMDYLEEFGSYNATDFSGDDEYDESTKKFGRKFMKESCDEEFDRYYERMKNIFRYDSGIHTRLRDNEDGSETIEVTFDDRYQWDDDVESGRIPLDKDARLEHWISRFDDAGHRNGWEFDYEIAKDIEHPIDGGANNDYLAMLTLTCKCDKEDDLLFENSSESTDDMEKEFTYKGISITRYDYESLPSPMAASKFSDEQMQEIAKDIYFELVNRGWDEKEIQKYVNNVDDYELPDAEMRIADKIRSDWWAAMEDVARYHGMEYYEDLPEEEENYTESKKARFGKKFQKMEESMNWNGVTDKFLDNDKVQFTRNCPMCGKPHSITVSIRDVEDGCAKYGRGARIQDAFPNFSPDEREFFMSGICPDCWENM